MLADKSKFYFLLLVCCLLVYCGSAQTLLNKTISLDVNRKPISAVLKLIGSQGGFSFSYNSNIIKEDSLVTIKIYNKPVHQVLDILFESSIEYKETANHIVLQTAPAYWYVSGYVIDELTGEKLINASVYEKQQLVASLTDEQGYFKLKLRDRLHPATISVSKSWYSDTSVQLYGGDSKVLTVSIAPKSFVLDSVAVTPNSQIEKTWLGNIFLSSRQKMQSLNINKYFVNKPYQASVIPGVGTHGKMSGQVVNKFSFNVLGGYTAGVNGFEIGGLFNIVRKDVRYAQVAGIFNITGGEVDGVQISGLYNYVLDTVNGVIVSGLSNTVMTDVHGVNISGLYSHTAGNTFGVQAAGLATYTHKSVDGTQIAGLGNIARESVDGGQIAGLFNYARKIDGTQIGIINIADTSSGYSIGLVNIILKGYHKLSISTNESLPFNIAFKTGNKNIYSILLSSFDTRNGKKLLGLGYGIGTDITIYKQLSFCPELSGQYLYLGNWHNTHVLSKVQLNLRYKFNKFFAMYAAPSINVYNIEHTTPEADFRNDIFPSYGANRILDNIYSWVGWSVGIDIF